ncbi:putative dehydrogenase [Ameyamaea chiangmaiensis NBRC 103196]|uniref:Gfo/Idh/MocA family oxidoreductase n=1 Tax=Ameyamaea chiangmaiensis TaxID=442969 RepID=A0A850P598_9PROT|nr:Gfo/Idh/MocA family oxidoreductase [Ameyamaea chiangmaiensis]MBS4076040.1 Gfo/Idh/MocA family oxidoreductase [Ameyamaea chiangmaiensis]NVN39815.1 Gfo/Idh/MocA family oxidoreductase [Ameyamaea chiangmaiensis]GBQ66794.1 putative dehydrogenase [Ameyamaea chiangmaiensis NBRC 103196]
MTKLAVVGVGKIAKTQHIPAITASPDFDLVAFVSPDGRGDSSDIPVFRSLEALAESALGVEAVALCTPPDVRSALAREALDLGLHVLLEKPPSTTVTDALALEAYALSLGLTIFATWHSAYSAAVPTARALLRTHDVQSATIRWQEDVEKWHPNATWFWEPGAFGVFDAGINALSILVSVSPCDIVYDSAHLLIPAGLHAPVLAEVSLRDPEDTIAIKCTFDWDYTGPDETWNIDWVLADNAKLSLSSGGAKLSLDGQIIVDAQDTEYAGLYRRFADLIARGETDVDTRPLALVTDILAFGAREQGPARK